ncbi:MAG: metallophosphoesterase [Planctomycetota bacterium]|nr:metallophosphoesterase [Planctomycetota bacterium]
MTPSCSTKIRLGWVTDIHLDQASSRSKERWMTSLRQSGIDQLLLTGDISNSKDLLPRLGDLHSRLAIPIRFVLGNHDYYGSSIEEVRSATNHFCEKREGLSYLGSCSPIPLTDRTVLIGCDGWADARFGTYAKTTVRLNDFLQIENLRGLDHKSLGLRLQELGDKEADSLQKHLQAVLPRFRHLIILTHVPPFEEACWYQGKAGHPDWSPFFSCWATGNLLRKTFMKYPRHHATVLCGHTHYAGVARILPNLIVRTGRAIYRQPEIQDPIIEIW